MPPTQYRPSRRSWVKLWVNEWLDSTVRWQLTPEQRSIWIDLLALAGHSRFPGIITPGTDGKGFIPFPMGYFCTTFGCSEEAITEAFSLFEHQQRIRNENGVLHIINWDKYQSEYQQKRQRTTYKTPQKVRGISTKKSAVVESEVEVEVDSEVEVEREVETEKPKPSTLAMCKADAFESFKVKTGKPPSWNSSDYTALSELFKTRPDLSFEEFNQRWANYLYSDDPFDVKQGFRLRYFCSNFDRFTNEATNGRLPLSKTQQRSRTNAAVLRGMVESIRGSDGGIVRNLPRGNDSSADNRLPERSFRPKP